MAFTQRYVSVAGGGSHDGTSEVNAWTFTEMLAASLVAGDFKVNIKAGTYSRTTTADTINAGLSTKPNLYRGYNSVIDDLEANGRTNNVGPLVTTNFPLISYTTGKLTLGDYAILEHLRVEGAPADFVITCGTGNFIRRCKVYNTAASGGASHGINASDTGNVVFDSDVRADSSGGVNLIQVARGFVERCQLRGDASATGVRTTVYGAVVGNIMFGIGTGVSCGGSDVWTLISGNSFNDIATATISHNAGSVLIADNIAWGDGAGSGQFYDNGGTVFPVMFANNAVGDMTNADDGRGNWLSYGGVALSVNPYTDTTTQDFRLNNTAGGGASVRAAAYWPFADIGAIQHQSVSGGARTLRPLVGSRNIGVY